MNYLIMDKNQNTIWVANDASLEREQPALPWEGETGLDETLTLPNGTRVYAVETDSTTIFTFLDEDGAPTDVIDDARSIESLIFMANARTRIPHTPEHYQALATVRSLFNAEYANMQLQQTM